MRFLLLFYILLRYRAALRGSVTRFIVSIRLCPLTHVLILQISIANTCVEIIDRFRLSNNVHNRQYICSLQEQCLIFRNLNSIKPFINRINIELYVFYYFTTIFHTVPFIQDGIFHTITLFINYGLTWVLQVAVQLYNQYLTILLQSLSHLLYTNFYCYFNMYILEVYNIQSRTPGLYINKNISQ